MTVSENQAAFAYVDTRKTGSDWWTPLQEWKRISEANKKGKVNHLKVVAVGEKIAAFLNNQLVAYIRDTNLTSGLVGFALFNNGPISMEQHVIFENMKIQIIQE